MILRKLTSIGYFSSLYLTLFSQPTSAQNNEFQPHFESRQEFISQTNAALVVMRNLPNFLDAVRPFMTTGAHSAAITGTNITRTYQRLMRANDTLDRVRIKTQTEGRSDVSVTLSNLADQEIRASILELEDALNDREALQKWSSDQLASVKLSLDRLATNDVGFRGFHSDDWHGGLLLLMVNVEGILDRALALRSKLDPDVIEIFELNLKHAKEVHHWVEQITGNFTLRDLAVGKLREFDQAMVNDLRQTIAESRERTKMTLSAIRTQPTERCAPKPNVAMTKDLKKIEATASDNVSRLDYLALVHQMAQDFMEGNEPLNNYYLAAEKAGKIGSMAEAIMIWKQGVNFIKQIPSTDRSPALNRTINQIELQLAEREMNLQDTEIGAMVLSRMSEVLQVSETECSPVDRPAEEKTK